jgi:hypothetical protein
MFWLFKEEEKDFFKLSIFVFILFILRKEGELYEVETA